MFQCFFVFLIFAFFCLSFSSLPLLLDFFKPKNGPPSEVLGTFLFCLSGCLSLPFVEMHNPVLPFLGLLELLVFSPCEDFLVFLTVFPFFSRHFRGSVGIKNPCFFFGGFPCLFLKNKERKDREGVSIPSVAATLSIVRASRSACGNRSERLQPPLPRVRSGLGKPNQRKVSSWTFRRGISEQKNGRNSWTFRFAPFFGLVCRGDSWAGGLSNSHIELLFRNAPAKRFMNWPFFGLVRRGGSPCPEIGFGLFCLRFPHRK